MFASYRHQVRDQAHTGSREAGTHSAALLSAHLGLLSSIFGRQADVPSLDHAGMPVPLPTARSGGAEDATDGCDVHVELESRELWSKFDTHCTEMVITKSGRYDNIIINDNNSKYVRPRGNCTLDASCCSL